VYKGNSTTISIGNDLNQIDDILENLKYPAFITYAATIIVVNKTNWLVCSIPGDLIQNLEQLAVHTRRGLMRHYGK
jgi:hypothetical protein